MAIAHSQGASTWLPALPVIQQGNVPGDGVAKISARSHRQSRCSQRTHSLVSRSQRLTGPLLQRWTVADQQYSGPSPAPEPSGSPSSPWQGLPDLRPLGWGGGTEGTGAAPPRAAAFATYQVRRHWRISVGDKWEQRGPIRPRGVLGTSGGVQGPRQPRG